MTIKNEKYIIVTGGAGFLGRHLCKKLLEDNNNIVICIDNLITGSLVNVEEFLENPKFKFINYDIISSNIINIIKSYDRVDEIYHLASLASPDKYKKYPIETIMVNFNGTKNMLDIAKKYNSKMLITSTSEVYGDPLVHPQPEEYYGNVNTIGERSCYDESKRIAETLMYEYKKYGLDLKIVRIFNTFGPYMNIDDGRVITNFIKAIKSKKEINIYGDGNQTRSFCYVDDMIKGLILVMSSSEFGPINLGNPESHITLNELVKIFENILNKKLNIKYTERTQDDPKCRMPVINKALNLGWNIETDLKEGIIKTYNHFIIN